MGWTETPKPKGGPLADFFHRHGATRWSEDSLYRYRVLASALVHASTWYAAVERVEKTTGERIVFALIFLVRMCKAKQPGGYNFGYKDMSEDMGPIEARCPERILDLLTPPRVCMQTCGEQPAGGTTPRASSSPGWRQVRCCASPNH